MIGCARLYVKTRCVWAACLPNSRRVNRRSTGWSLSWRFRRRVRTHEWIGPASRSCLLDQNRALWDQLLIRRGLAALDRAAKLARARGPYVLQAAIVACHARARTAGETDWARIATLYSELAQLIPSPVIELNRAVAIGMAVGSQAGLDLVDALASDEYLRTYHLLPSVRGDLLAKLGRAEEAAAEFERAAAMTRNTRERTLLLDRAAACKNESNSR